MKSYLVVMALYFSVTGWDDENHWVDRWAHLLCLAWTLPTVAVMTRPLYLIAILLAIIAGGVLELVSPYKERQ